MPAPLRDPVEQTLTGKVTRLWGGDNFEFLSGKETHYFLLRGVDAPQRWPTLFQPIKKCDPDTDERQASDRPRDCSR